MIHWKGHLGVGLKKGNINGRKEDQLGNHCIIIQVGDEDLN